jgi:glycosyltransferase involved in cell wall biosynthesis/GR25 family glycosyltransferase involved in LPS biosynthesis
MPTFERREFVPRAVECFLQQDYGKKELVVVDDGTVRIRDLLPMDSRIRYIRLARRTALGTKRNIACRHARGSIIVHWDDDDWSAPWRVSYQVAELQASGADVCGLSRVLYWDERLGRAWWYEYPGTEPWVAGNSLCYHRQRWQQTPFPATTIGEDAAFLHARPQRIRTLARDDFLVARIHANNSAPKRVTDAAFTPCPVEVVTERLTQDARAHAAPEPMVSCIMPTFERRSFVPLALEYFERQTYASRELVVVDDGRDAIRDLLPRHPSIRYVRLNQRTPLGEKRNIAVEHSRGELIVHWDDDDWYAPERIARQVAPILAGTADVTGLRMPFALELSGPKLWRCSPELHARMHAGDLWPGTLAYKRALWLHARYPAIQLREDCAFLASQPASTRVVLLQDANLAVPVRHGRNTWTIRESFGAHPEHWQPAAGAQHLEGDWARYEALCGARPAPQQRAARKRFPRPSSAGMPIARRTAGTLKTWPEATFVLNLERSRDRRAHIERELVEHWPAGAERLSAFDGSTVDVAALRRAHVVKEIGWLAEGLSGGQLGCWLSHLTALTTLLQRGLRAALILEDDACLSPVIASDLATRLGQLSRARGSADLIFLGCYEGYGWWAPTRPRTLLPGGFFQLGRQTRGCPGAYAYIVTAQGARKLVQRLLARPIDQPIDQVYREQSERGLRTYCAVPPLATISGYDSVINIAPHGELSKPQTELFLQALASAKTGSILR